MTWNYTKILKSCVFETTGEQLQQEKGDDNRLCI